MDQTLMIWENNQNLKINSNTHSLSKFFKNSFVLSQFIMKKLNFHRLLPSTAVFYT